MAVAAGAQSLSRSSSPCALNFKLLAALPPRSCRISSPILFQPSLWQSSCSQLPPLRQRLRTHSSSLSCCKHEECLSTTHMAHCLSSSPLCSHSNIYQFTCKGLQKRLATVIAFAAADSDQSQSSHEELGEGTIGCCEGEEQPLPRRPNSEIKQGDVVQVQLRALREQDFATLFEFASPKNKAHTGPLSKFTEMIQGRAYSVMLGHSSAKVLSTLSVGPDRFQQRIFIEGANGKQAVFSWSLSRQVSSLSQRKSL
ncbi:hypothetical protein L7F22_035558 [Adiantum nelumboides]|nr:hypothetical protein [Adiantum nelumboides]